MTGALVPIPKSLSDAWMMESDGDGDDGGPGQGDLARFAHLPGQKW
jgi:hypothetical protein